MRTRFSRVVALLLMATMLVLPASAAVKVTDDVGKTLTFTSVPKRVISLAPMLRKSCMPLELKAA